MTLATGTNVDVMGTPKLAAFRFTHLYGWGSYKTQQSSWFRFRIGLQFKA